MSLNIKPKNKTDRAEITFKTKTSLSVANAGYDWWNRKDPAKRGEELLATLVYLKQSQASLQRQAAVCARLYSGQALFSFIGANMSLMDQYSPLAPNRPTYNLISSITDTLVSRLTQDRPIPVFLTDQGDYKQRNLAKEMNRFISGEFYRTKAHDIGRDVLTDALGWAGTGCLKIYAGQDKKVKIERKLKTSLFVDLQEAAFGEPRRLYETALYDRKVLLAMFPDKNDLIALAEKATVDKSSQSSQTVSDLVMVVEGWSLPSGEDEGDGVHSIAVTSGELFTEVWTKKTFPFVFLHHHKRALGFWSMSIAENLMGTQLELNSLLDTISKSIKLMGVPRVFYDNSAKINKASFANKIGTLIATNNINGIKIDTSPPVSQDLYAERDRIIGYGYNQEGASQLSATSQKPEGLDSGEAQRVYHNINSERFASLERKYANFYVDLAYQVIETAKDIAEQNGGKYSTVFVDRKKGRKEVDLPSLKLLKDEYVIQAFVESSLPKDPAGRLSKVVEMLQGGMIDISEARRLLDFPDLGEAETLANAAQERIYMMLDEIVENSKYADPDQFLPIPRAEQVVVQYINLYSCCQLEEKKLQQLRDWFDALQVLKQQAQPPAPAQPVPQAQPQPLPQSNLVPNAAGPVPGAP